MAKLIQELKGYQAVKDLIEGELSDYSYWTIENKDPELLGCLEKVRVGAWMSWCLFLEPRCYLSAGCQDEVREMTKILNAKGCVKLKTNDVKENEGVKDVK